MAQFKQQKNDLSKFKQAITVLNENEVDYRCLNYIRLTILKERNGAVQESIEERVF